MSAGATARVNATATWVDGLKIEPPWKPSFSPTCELVLSEHGDLRGVHEAIALGLCKHVYVYSKTNSCAALKETWEKKERKAVSVCEDLPNVGREQHTFLYHVAKHYHQLSEHVLFAAVPLDDSHTRMQVLVTGLALMEGGVTIKDLPVISSFFCLFSSIPVQNLQRRYPSQRMHGYRPMFLENGTDTQEVSEEVPEYPVKVALASQVISLGHDEGNDEGEEENEDAGEDEEVGEGQARKQDTSEAAFSLPVSAHPIHFRTSTSLVFERAGRLGSDLGERCNGIRPCVDFVVSKDGERQVTPADYEPLWAWEMVHSGISPHRLMNVPACFEGTATTTRLNIKNRPQAVYEEMRDATMSADLTEASYYGRRLMAANFGPRTDLWHGGWDSPSAGSPSPDNINVHAFTNPIPMTTIALTVVMAVIVPVTCAIMLALCVHRSRTHSLEGGRANERTHLQPGGEGGPTAESIWPPKKGSSYS